MFYGFRQLRQCFSSRLSEITAASLLSECVSVCVQEVCADVAAQCLSLAAVSKPGGQMIKTYESMLQLADTNT